MKKGTLLDELGISKNTILLEIEGGLLTEVHNAPDGYVVFDWDYIKEEGETSKKCIVLQAMLEAIKEEQATDAGGEE